MVSSDKVTSDASELVSKLSTYSSTVSGLDGVWKGISHDSLTQNAEQFVGEYNAIQGQMSSFAQACSEYVGYESLKQKILEAQYAMNQANDEDKGSYVSAINQMTSERNRIKNSILQNLNAASSPKLEAASISATVSVGSGATQVVAGANSAFIKTLMSEVGNTISNYPDLGFHDGQWCADFASEMLIRNGCNIPRCSVAGDGTDDYDIFYALRNNGSVVHLDSGAAIMGYGDSSEYDPNYTPQAGDVVLFNWDADDSTDHVGFVVEDNGDGTITTLEGNTSGDAGSSCVAVRTRDRNLVYGYATPVFQA